MLKKQRSKLIKGYTKIRISNKPYRVSFKWLQRLEDWNILHPMDYTEIKTSEELQQINNRLERVIEEFVRKELLQHVSNR